MNGKPPTLCTKHSSCLGRALPRVSITKTPVRAPRERPMVRVVPFGLLDVVQVPRTTMGALRSAQLHRRRCLLRQVTSPRASCMTATPRRRTRDRSQRAIVGIAAGSHEVYWSPAASTLVRCRCGGTAASQRPRSSAEVKILISCESVACYSPARGERTLGSTLPPLH